MTAEGEPAFEEHVGSCLAGEPLLVVVVVVGLEALLQDHVVVGREDHNHCRGPDETGVSAWVKFTLGADSNGNRKITITGHSPCDSAGMCGEVSANR